MKSALALLAVIVATPAAAQQTAAPPSTVALQINQAIASMALMVENLQQQVAADQARIKDLEQKCGDRCNANTVKK